MMERREKSRMEKPRRRWMPTSLSYATDYDTSMLREVYVNGVRFVRDRKVDHDDVDSLE